MSLETINEFNKNIKLCKTGDNIATQLVVAVMTVCGSLGSEVNLLEIFDYYIEEGYDSFELNYSPNSKNSEKKSVNNSENKKSGAFYNCLNVSFSYKDSDLISSNIVAKIFPNGSIQIPGCRTVEAVHKVPEMLFNFINDVTSLCVERKPEVVIIKDPANFNLKDVRIVMINSNFTFSKCIKQENLKNLINSKKFDGINDRNTWRLATFAPEKYSGINIRYLTKRCRQTIRKDFLDNKNIPMKGLDGQVSIFIFKSGKGTITGAKNTKDLLEAYNAIADIVRNNTDFVFHTPPPKITEPINL